MNTHWRSTSCFTISAGFTKPFESPPRWRLALTEGVSVLNQYNIDLNPASAANAHITAGAAAGGFLNSTAWLQPDLQLA